MEDDPRVRAAVRQAEDLLREATRKYIGEPISHELLGKVTKEYAESLRDLPFVESVEMHPGGGVKVTLNPLRVLSMGLTPEDIGRLSCERCGLELSEHRAIAVSSATRTPRETHRKNMEWFTPCDGSGHHELPGRSVDDE